MLLLAEEFFSTTPTISGNFFSTVQSAGVIFSPLQASISSGVLLFCLICRGFGLGTVLNAGMGYSVIKAVSVLVLRIARCAKDHALVEGTRNYEESKSYVLGRMHATQNLL